MIESTVHLTHAHSLYSPSFHCFVNSPTSQAITDARQKDAPKKERRKSADLAGHHLESMNSISQLQDIVLHFVDFL